MAVERNDKLEEQYQQMLWIAKSNMAGLDMSSPVAISMLNKSNKFVKIMLWPAVIFLSLITLAGIGYPPVGVPFGIMLAVAIYFLRKNTKRGAYFKARLKEDQDAGVFKATAA